jgi:hypothetical protein
VLAGWIPNQYWEESLKNNPRVTDAQKEDLRKALQDYTVVCVVDAKKGGLAVFNFTSAEDVIKTAKLTDSDGQTAYACSGLRSDAGRAEFFEHDEADLCQHTREVRSKFCFRGVPK